MPANNAPTLVLTRLQDVIVTTAESDEDSLLEFAFPLLH